MKEEVLSSDIMLKIKSAIKFLLRRWWKILLASLLGAVLGIVIARMRPITYTAKLSFILEEAKGGSGLASLAGQFGFDLNGLSGGNSLLSADNITLFLKSTSLTTETLLTPYNTNSDYSLADRYSEVYNLKEQWKRNKNIGVDVSFPANSSKPFTRLQDSLLQFVVEQVSTKHISINKPDRKASFVEVTTTMKDELLSKYYCERLVTAAITRYVDIKTNRQTKNISSLQKRADSIATLLNMKTYSSAAAQERILDINPAFRSISSVPSEVMGRDKVMLSAIYTEIVKNIEVSKMALSQETPVIQIIDNVQMPLKKNVTSKMLSAVIGGILFGLMLSAIFIVQFLIGASRNK